MTLSITLGMLLMFTGGGLGAYAYDRATSERILPGVRIAGVDVSGMNREEAIAAVSEAAGEILGRQVEVRAADRTWHVAPAELGTRADVEGKVDQALAYGDALAWPARVFHRLLNRSVDRSLELELSYDREAIQRFVETVARTVNVSPSDASVEVVNEEIVLTRPRVGRAVRMRHSRELLVEAMGGRTDAVEFTLRTLRPEVTSRELGHTIVVRLSELRLYFYDGVNLAKTYPVAAGQPVYPTPRGQWAIVNKVANPSWTNPDPKGWGKDLPRYIPPGPGNPLGNRALYLDAPGIRIHGTYASGSIGTYASHGCIRMYLSDVEELFSTAEVGTPVYILW